MAISGATLRQRCFTHVVYVHRVFSSTWFHFLFATRRLLAVDGWICVTNHQADFLRDALGPQGGPVTVFSQGEDTAFFDPNKVRSVGQRSYILAVASEMSDYSLLFAAVRDLDIELVVKASNAWMAAERCEFRSAPSNVNILTQRLSYVELRDLYAGAALVVVPLYATPQAATSRQSWKRWQ